MILNLEAVMTRHLIAFAALCWVPFGLAAQDDLDITGSWQADTPDGPQTVVVRSDSTASFGEETVRWRITADTIFIQFGDEWVGYNFLLEGNSLTLSGGDLMDPITLKRVQASFPGRSRAVAGNDGGPIHLRAWCGLVKSVQEACIDRADRG